MSNTENKRDAEITYKSDVIGEACSAFSVDYCLIEHGEMQFAAYYDAERRITIAARMDAASEWHQFQPVGVWLEQRGRFSHYTDYDSHNYLTLAVDELGFLHLAGNMHVDPLIYFRSSAPFDITTLGVVPTMVGASEQRMTYPLFFMDFRGRLLFRYREGESGNGSDIYNIYNSATQKWERLLETPLIDGEGRRSAYARPPLPGPDGYWHLVFMWRESPDCATCNNLCYARSRDLLQWERYDGTPLSLPIKYSQCEVVDPGRPGCGLINMSQELGFDSLGLPVITYHRYDGLGNSQAYAARPDNGEWKIYKLSDWEFRWGFSGGGSIPADVVVSSVRISGPDLLEVDFSSAWCTSGTWVINQTSFRVLEAKQHKNLLPADLYYPSQRLNDGVLVQVRPALDDRLRQKQDLFIRWESLPIARDAQPLGVAYPTTLEVIDLRV